ncbi:MAG: hypothetical protein RMJ98_06310 [Myxococcales bacterium]|nr:hypothetical protein [Polyangiaceae bacterium]MDW8248901.1 hypothetical protein [Myxococcales bacterium]
MAIFCIPEGLLGFGGLPGRGMVEQMVDLSNALGARFEELFIAVREQIALFSEFPSALFPALALPSSFEKSFDSGTESACRREARLGIEFEGA